MTSTEIGAEIVPEGEALRRAQEQRARELIVSLVHEQEEIAGLREELDGLPRDVLVEVAWKTDRDYQWSKNDVREDASRVEELEKRKDMVRSFLTDTERDQASRETAAWMENY
jgi:hypothetical protein